MRSSFPGNSKSMPSPTPFNAQISLQFQLDQNTYTSLIIYDTHGRYVTTLAQGDFGSGEHSLTWNGTNQNGDEVSSGVYLFVLQTSAQQEVKKLTLLK